MTLGVEQMGYKLVVFHQLFVDCILVAWLVVRSDMARSLDYLLLLYFPAYLA